MAEPWIDFKALKASVSIRDVLDRYGYLDKLEEKKAGTLVGPCPIHGGTGKASFNVDVGKNVFNCFSKCGGGNVLDLVMKVEGIEIREAGEKIADWFGLSFERNGQAGKGRNSAKVSEKTELAADHQADGDKINPPLERPLQNLNPDHRYLTERGLTLPTIQRFGVGYCSRGMMRGRIAIEIHNVTGDIVAYAGRAITEELAKEKGKYKLPANFKKSHEVYNLHRVYDCFPTRKENAGGLIVVEGFFDAMKVDQAGFYNVVALMGSTLSEEQAELLVKHTDRLALMFDGDEAGYNCLREFYKKLRKRLYLKEIHLEDGEQPDSLPAERIQALLS